MPILPSLKVLDPHNLLQVNFWKFGKLVVNYHVIFTKLWFMITISHALGKPIHLNK